MKTPFNLNTVFRIAVLLVVMIVSITILAPIMSKPETYSKTIAKLNEKQMNIMEVSATATVSSITLAAIPDDATTPVANKIMDLAGYLVLVLCTIVMEKYMLTIFGSLAFQYLLPAICALLILNTFLKNPSIAKLASKIFAVGLTLLLVVPVSVRISDMIEETYKVSIATTADHAIEETQAEETKSSVSETEIQKLETEVPSTEETSGNLLDRFLHSVNEVTKTAKDTTSQISQAVSNAAGSAASAITSLTDEAIAKAKDMLNDLIETIVVLIVTNCLLPVMVLLFLFWIIKLITGIQINLPDPGKITKKWHKKPENR
ncbi:MAG: hypothetical protein MR487_12370 [Lachnospiraceae bacterium]|nr:hypothetical protein [Lachnospiraceae bacterium]